jgi:hypothetical protein
LTKMSAQLDATAPIRTEHVTQAILNDLRSHTRFTEQKAFLDKFFPLQEVHKKILVSLIESGIYNNETRKWADLPDQPDGPESNYYEPFQKRCEDIAKAYCKFENKTKDRVWLNRTSKKPELESFMYAAENRPDIISVLGWRSVVNHYLTFERKGTRSQGAPNPV